MRHARKPIIDPKDLPAIEAATLRRILGHVAPYRWQAFIVLACVTGAALFNLTAPWFVKRIVDEAIPQANITLLLFYCGGMIAGPLVAGLLQIVQKYGAENIGQQVMLDLRIKVYRQLHDMPFDFFAKQKPGEAVSHVLNDVQGVGGVVSNTLVDLAQNAIVLACTLLFIFALDWRLAIVAVSFLPLFAVSTKRVGRARKRLKRIVQARTSELTGMLTETLSVSGALLVKIFGREQAEVERFAEKLHELKILSLEQTLVGRWFQMVLKLFESIGPALAFAIGGALVIRGHLQLGTVVAFVTVLKRLYGPASDLATAHVDLKTSYAYFDRIFAVMDRTPAIRNVEGALIPPRIVGDVEFRGVSLAYDDSGDVLSRINLNVPAGATIGLVGPSGAGKTSLVSLVMRLYDPTSGSVLVDGIDVRDLQIESLRERIAVVTQDTFLLNATVLENLRYAKPSASKTDIEDAARRAQIHEVIAALPQGYDTLVGDRGYRFSAGERQRLAIARAILKNPKILILDEATSSLDVGSEQKVQAALNSLMRGRTSFVIAHRLATVRDADCIVVMKQGRLAEIGSHDQLLAARGLYAWMWRAQAREDARHQKPAAAVRSGAFTVAPIAAQWRRPLVPAQEIPR
ncbi:MAG TPA: ABC transporter ATP-binding protein [Vicinamibacterales bacterium]